MAYQLPFPDLDKPLHLLVIDNREAGRTEVKTRLREVVPPDTRISEAANGQIGIEMTAVAIPPIDCVLIDMGLHDINGVELTKLIRALRPETTIVMIAAEADMDAALRCIKAGAEDYLIKGEYTAAGLNRAVRYAIERHRASLENYKLHEALERERELSAAQKEFINLVSHEFRTPIAIVSGAVQLLAIKAPKLHAGRGAAQFKKIDNALNRLVGLLDNVLRLSKVEEGKEIFSPENFDMRQAIEQVAEHFDSKRLLCHLPPEPTPYHGDLRLVEYALHNVISNGLKYSPNDTMVEVRLDTLPTGLEILVVDHGIGMSSESIAHAGEKFFRAKNTSHIEGTGLGIHLAQRFVQYHGGTMTFCSAPQEGTTVRLFFPFDAKRARAA